MCVCFAYLFPSVLNHRGILVKAAVDSARRAPLPTLARPEAVGLGIEFTMMHYSQPFLALSFQKLSV